MFVISNFNCMCSSSWALQKIVYFYLSIKTHGWRNQHYFVFFVSAEEFTLRLYCERAKIEDGQTVMVGRAR